MRRYIQEQEKWISTDADAALSGSRYLKPSALPEVADTEPGDCERMRGRRNPS